MTLTIEVEDAPINGSWIVPLAGVPSLVQGTGRASENIDLSSSLNQERDLFFSSFSPRVVACL